MPEFPIGFTFRTKCGTGRATYDPEGSKTLPWKVVKDGTVFNRAGTLGVAKLKLAQRGCAV